MKRMIPVVIAASFVGQSILFGQGGDAAKILADVRAAIGGPAVTAPKSLVATGRSTRVNNGVQAEPTDFEMAIEFPDKFVKKEVMAVMGETVISRSSGFNGDGLIDAMDAPGGMFTSGGGGGPMVMRAGGGNGSMSLGGAPPSAEAAATARKNSVLTSKQEFARLTMGMLGGSSFAGYPLTFAVDSPATTPDGKFDVLKVTGDGDFAAKLFIDRQTHLPAMVTWMAKEPLVRTMRGGGPGGAPVSVTSSGDANGQVMTRTFSTSTGGGGQTITSGGTMTPEMRDQMMKDAAAAEANRRMVEFRITYGDFKTVNGIKMASKFTRTIDGKPADELVLEKVTLNAKIDPKKFDVVK